MTSPTQTQRVLRALRGSPVAATDFAAPNVREVGRPIMRLAARIAELRDQGHHITAARAPNGTAIYHLHELAVHGNRSHAEQASSTADGNTDSPGHSPWAVAAPGSPHPAGGHLFNPGEHPAAPAPHHQQEAA